MLCLSLRLVAQLWHSQKWTAQDQKGDGYLLSLGFSDDLVAGQGELLAVQYKHLSLIHI